MKKTSFLSCVTLLLATTGVVAATVDGLRVIPQSVFQDYSWLYARIIADRQLGNPNDESLTQQMQAQSGVDHFRDRSVDPIAVIRVELLSQDGTSKVRSANGDYPFYVVRETRTGLVLLGRMFGRSYRSTVTDGKREFFVELHPSDGAVKQMHYRIEDEILVNLSAPPPSKFADHIALAPTP